MQYLVHTSGNVVDFHEKAYIVNAESKEDAQEIAKSNFMEEFYVVDDNVCVKSYKRRYKAILACIFMMIPVFLSFINWKIGHDTVSIQPNYISCLYAVILYSSYIVRFKGIRRTVGSWIDIGLSIILILLLSSFIRTILVIKYINILGIKKIVIDTNIILPITILLSWCGLKFFSILSMACVGILAMFSISELNEAMAGIAGPAYIICAFIGILIYLSIEPAMFEMSTNLKKSIVGGVDHLKRDLIYAEKEVKKFNDLASNKLNKK